GDNVTADLNVIFSSDQSGFKDPAATIQLIDDVNNNGIYEQGIDRLLGSYSATGATWSISRTLDPSATMHLGFVQYDAAGNYSRLSPTTTISTVSADNHMGGAFSGTSNSATATTQVAGMGVGIDQTGQLQFTVR